MNTETIIQKFEEQEIAFDLFKGDVMVNATEMAKPFGKRLDPFMRSKGTKAFIKALSQSSEFLAKHGFNSHQLVGIKISDVKKKIYSSQRGRYHNGTYMCEELALQLAMWLSPEFNVWVIQTFQKIIFGDNPELVREAVMNLPRIQRDLDKYRRKRNRMKAVLLGPERRKEYGALLHERTQLSYQIQNLSMVYGNEGLYMSPEKLGTKLMELVMLRDKASEQLKQLNEEHEKILVKEDYVSLCSEIATLEGEQRHFAKLIRYSNAKLSDN